LVLPLIRSPGLHVVGWQNVWPPSAEQVHLVWQFCSQFHKHFTQAFFVRKYFLRRFSLVTVWLCNFFDARILSQKLLVKCLWNRCLSVEGFVRQIPLLLVMARHHLWKLNEVKFGYNEHSWPQVNFSWPKIVFPKILGTFKIKNLATSNCVKDCGKVALQHG